MFLPCLTFPGHIRNKTFTQHRVMVFVTCGKNYLAAAY